MIENKHDENRISHFHQMEEALKDILNQVKLNLSVENRKLY